MRQPIVVFDTDTKEIMIFRSLAEAQSYIEPYDINVYEIYDSDGLSIWPTLNQSQEQAASSLKPWTVVLTPSDERKVSQLQKHLASYLNRIDIRVEEPDTVDQ